MSDHIDRAISSCASSKFALRTLRSLGLRSQEFHLVARATTVTAASRSLQDASPAWWGFATEEQLVIAIPEFPNSGISGFFYIPKFRNFGNEIMGC